MHPRAFFSAVYARNFAVRKATELYVLRRFSKKDAVYESCVFALILKSPNCFILNRNTTMQIKKITLAAIVFLAAFNAVSATPILPTAIVTDTKSLIVRLEQAATVSIEAENGLVLYTETTAAAPAKRYKVNSLSDGSYRLVVRQGYTQTTQVFHIESGKVSIQANGTTVSTLPVLVQKGDKLDVSYFAGQPTDIRIALYDNMGVKIMEKAYNSALVQQRFDLSRLPSGVYFATVSAGSLTTDFFTIGL